MIVETRGEWRKFEKASGQTFEIGKTYNIVVDGNCEFAVSAEKPTAGINTNTINFTAVEGVYLWIKTGEK